MKKTKNIIKIAAAVCLFLAAAFLGHTASLPARADAYSFSVSQYDATYDVRNDYTLGVREDITIEYTGYSSTGFIRDIPVNAGDRVTNVNVCELVGGKETPVDYDVYIEYSEFLSVDIGDTSKKTGQSHTYRITYDYAVTKPQTDADYDKLSLNAVGFGWECAIGNVNITYNLPNGFIPSQTRYYKGNTATGSADFSYDEAAARLTLHVDSLNRYEGVTFDLVFEKGTMTKKTNLIPLLFALIGLIPLAAALVLKFLVWKEKELTPVVNFTAPDEMDPLLMGKYIDNTVNNEDVTSLIYYWAGKGFIKINLQDEKNPKLIRIVQNLPEEYPHYQKLMYANMFKGGDMTSVSALANKFYVTVQTVTNEVNASAKDLYDKKSMTVSFVFLVLAALFSALIPNVCGMATVSKLFFSWIYFVAAIPVFLVYGMFMTVQYNKLKLGERKYKLSVLGVLALSAALSLLAGLVAALFGLTAVMEFVFYALCLFFGCLTAMASVWLIKRSDGYTEKLNHIVGFKNFITVTEKDRLEAMLADDPQLYYNVLPYAQVLGVSDIWEKKFEGIAMQPPQWATGNNSLLGTYIEVRIISSLLRNTSANMTRSMVSRPQSSGASGGGGHGNFGGFGGGGHGGGGGRGR